MTEPFVVTLPNILLLDAANHLNSGFYYNLDGGYSEYAVSAALGYGGEQVFNAIDGLTTRLNLKGFELSFVQWDSASLPPRFTIGYVVALVMHTFEVKLYGVYRRNVASRNSRARKHPLLGFVPFLLNSFGDAISPTYVSPVSTTASSTLKHHTAIEPINIYEILGQPLFF